MKPVSDPSLIQLCIKFVLSVGVGLAVGIERAINNRDSVKKISARDFALIAILAFATSFLYPQNQLAWGVAFVAIVGLALTVLVIENVHAGERQTGMTTLLAMPLTFVVASLPNFGANFWVVASIVFVTLLLLHLKEEIAQFIDGLDRREVIDFAILIGIAISITPLIPESAKLEIPLVRIDELPAFHMDHRIIAVHALWSVVVMVSLMSFAAHFITKYAKGRNALVLATFFGGLVSSLATVLMLLRNNGTRRSEAEPAENGALTPKEIFLGFVAANTGSIVKNIVAFRMVVGEDAFSDFMLPMAAAMALSVSMSAYAFSIQNKGQDDITLTTRPLPLNFVFKFSATLALLLVAMTMTAYYLGDRAMVLASFLSSIINSAAAMTSIGASLQQDGGISREIAGLAITAAFTGSFVAKYAVIARRLGLKASLPFIVPIVALALVTYGSMRMSVGE